MTCPMIKIAATLAAITIAAGLWAAALTTGFSAYSIASHAPTACYRLAADQGARAKGAVATRWQGHE